MTAMTNAGGESELERLAGLEQQGALRPKSHAVFRYLLEHAGQVVGKEELLVACWPQVRVSAAALKVCISFVAEIATETIG